jgi:hypothetical protein
MPLHVPQRDRPPPNGVEHFSNSAEHREDADADMHPPKPSPVGAASHRELGCGASGHDEPATRRIHLSVASDGWQTAQPWASGLWPPASTHFPSLSHPIELPGVQTPVRASHGAQHAGQLEQVRARCGARRSRRGTEGSRRGRRGQGSRTAPVMGRT